MKWKQGMIVVTAFTVKNRYINRTFDDRVIFKRDIVSGIRKLTGKIGGLTDTIMMTMKRRCL